tara:strand:- start:23542 stop:24348 length:807 start_codon:yes stop_codon:yes gene_type:complete
MTKIIVMTDIHITSEGTDIIGLNPLDRFQDVFKSALTDHPDAAYMILMGDLTHLGECDQYLRLQHVLADSPVPVIAMLGNHDIREKFREVFVDAPRDQNDFVQHIIDLPHHRIITLDTKDGPFGHHAGRLCPARIAWLQAALDGAQGRIPLVFMHHPPFETGIVGMDAINLENGAQVLDLLSRYPSVHLFCGHIHRTISGSTRSVAWTMFKSPCHQGVLDFVDPCSSLCVDEPGAYGLLLLGPEGVVAHSQDVGFKNEIERDTASMTD